MLHVVFARVDVGDMLSCHTFEVWVVTATPTSNVFNLWLQVEHVGLRPSNMAMCLTAHMSNMFEIVRTEVLGVFTAESAVKSPKTSPISHM